MRVPCLPTGRRHIIKIKIIISMKRTGVFSVKKGTVSFTLLLIIAGGFASYKAFSQDIPQNISILLETLQPLSHDRDKRELIYQYSVGDLSSLSNEDAKFVINELAKRGIGVITFWQKGEAMETCVNEGIRIARIQNDLGLSVAVDASRLLYGFYDGTPSTAHVNDEGKIFSDS